MKLTRRKVLRSSAWRKTTAVLAARPKVWLVTGSAGFIGSHLVEALLQLNQRVIGLDNYSTGSRQNLAGVRAIVGPRRWRNFRQITGDIRDLATCQKACRRADYVLHQAAFGSVPRSIKDPAAFHANNATGFLNMLLAARDNQVKRFVYATTSAVYGDHPALPKVEENIGRCLSPYAATKRANEIYAGVFGRCYGLQTIGLRYFNVFGPRQNPDGAYAAVVPRWIAAMIDGQPVHINGDGQTSRDFCYVANVVQANLLAATVQRAGAINEIYNVAAHARTSLNELFSLIRDQLLPRHPHLKACRPVYRDFSPGDVRHSFADISKAKRLLGYRPTHSVAEGLAEALDWYESNSR